MTSSIKLSYQECCGRFQKKNWTKIELKEQPFRKQQKLNFDLLRQLVPFDVLSHIQGCQWKHKIDNTIRHLLIYYHSIDISVFSVFLPFFRVRSSKCGSQNKNMKNLEKDVQKENALESSQSFVVQVFVFVNIYVSSFL